MSRFALMLVPLWLLAPGCGESASASGDQPPVADSGLPDSSQDAAAENDTSVDDVEAPLDGMAVPDAPTYDADAPEPGDAIAEDANPAPPDAGPDAPVAYVPGSLASCWTDATCPRVMAVAHGGAWDAVNLPYDSSGAIANAYAIGCDGVKVDVRVTKDNVPIIAHSSPIEYYESLDCGGKKIEEMTAAQVTKCHRLPSLTETFQRLDEVLNLVRGKMVAQLCVKESTDYGRTIAEIQAQSAEDFAFIELSSTADLQAIIPGLPGADSVWYLVNVASDLGEVDTLLDVIHNPRAFMYEFDPTVDVSTLTPSRLHPAGIRSFTYDSATPLLAPKIQTYFEGGFDVVSTQSAANAVQARKVVNAARGVVPP